jgi:peptidoglycan/xylan/chitin deacetylase (PgdA/CDA1 family)
MSRILCALSLFVALPLFAVNAPIATVLCYHEVDPPQEQHATIPRRSADADADAGSEQRRYCATPDHFHAQLDYLEANGYHVVSLAQLVDALKNASQLPPRSVVITVDDGWRCAYAEIFPELARREMPFTVFVYPHIVGRGEHALSWKQIDELVQSGIDIESHTFTHPFLTRKNNADVDADDYPAFLTHELLDSQRELESRTGVPVRFLAYPFGDYDASVIEAARRFGYRAAVTTRRGPVLPGTSPMELPRYLVHDDTTLEEFKTFLLP